jgi:hypothetical protein
MERWGVRPRPVLEPVSAPCQSRVIVQDFLNGGALGSLATIPETGRRIPQMQAPFRIQNHYRWIRAAEEVWYSLNLHAQVSSNICCQVAFRTPLPLPQAA